MVDINKYKTYELQKRSREDVLLSVRLETPRIFRSRCFLYVVILKGMNATKLRGCSDCDYTGYLYLYTRAGHDGEPQEIEVKCECQEEN